jgi:RHS repeat-associated protein
VRPVRSGVPSLTEYTYTGQYSHAADFGLMFYNARWYDVSLGRFAQADSIVPPGVQGLDRYAYVNNSPMNYVDPSGHVICNDEGVCLAPPNQGSNNNVPQGGPWNQGGGSGNTDDEETVNWADVVDDLNEEADNIRNDIAGQLIDELIGEGLMTTGGWVIGSAMKCPVPNKFACGAVGGLAGLFSAFFIATTSNMVRTSEADTYDAVGSAILQGMDETSSEIDFQIEHFEEVNIDLNSPFLMTDDFTIPEHYVLSVNGAEQPVTMLPSEYDVFISIVNSNTVH